MHDWPLLIEEIRASGYTLHQIAAAVGAKSHGAITNIQARRTQEPSYSIGSALISLHKKALRKARRAKA